MIRGNVAGMKALAEICQQAVVLPAEFDAEAFGILQLSWPKIDPNFTDADGNNFLIHAVRSGQPKKVTFLLQNSCDFTQRNKAGRHALAEARAQAQAAQKTIALLQKIEQGNLKSSDVDHFLGVVAEVRKENKSDSASSTATTSDAKRDDVAATVAKSPELPAIHYQALLVLLTTTPSGQSREQYLVTAVKDYNAKGRNALAEVQTQLQDAQNLIKLLYPITTGALEVRDIAKRTAVPAPAQRETKTTDNVADPIANAPAKTAAKDVGKHARSLTLSFAPKVLTVDQQRLRAATDFSYLLSVLQPGAEIINDDLWKTIASHMKNFIQHKSSGPMIENGLKLLQKLCAFNAEELGQNAVRLETICMALSDEDFRAKMLSDDRVDKVKLLAALSMGLKLFVMVENLEAVYRRLLQHMLVDFDDLDSVNDDAAKAQLFSALTVAVEVCTADEKFQQHQQRFQEYILDDINAFLAALQPTSEVLLHKSGEALWSRTLKWMQIFTAPDNDATSAEAKLKVALDLVRRLCSFSSDVLGLREPCLDAICGAFANVTLCSMIMADSSVDKTKLLAALARGMKRFPDAEGHYKAVHYFLGLESVMTAALAAEKAGGKVSGKDGRQTSAAAEILKPVREKSLDRNPNLVERGYAKAFLRSYVELLSGKREEKRHDSIVNESKKSGLTLDLVQSFKADFLMGKTEAMRITAAVNLLQFYKHKAKKYPGELHYWMVRVFSQLPQLAEDPRVIELLKLGSEHDQNPESHLVFNIGIMLGEIQGTLAERVIVREVAPSIYDNCLVYLVAQGLKSVDGHYADFEPKDSMIASGKAGSMDENARLAANIMQGMQAENVDCAVIEKTALGQLPPPSRPVAKSMSVNAGVANLSQQAPATAVSASSNPLSSSSPPVVSLAEHQLQRQPQQPVALNRADATVDSSTAPVSSNSNRPVADLRTG